MRRASHIPFRWARGMRYRERPALAHAQLRWYDEVTRTYRLTAHHVVPAGLRLLARVTVEGGENVPLTGPVILAANHRDNLDGYLLLHIVPRMLHFAGREDGFGTRYLCGFWRRLGAFPADTWGMRHAMDLLANGSAVGMFPQGMISADLELSNAAVGMLALRSGAPVVPVAISGTEAVHLSCLFARRASINVRFGAPLTFSRSTAGAPRSRAVAEEILRHIGALLPDRDSTADLTVRQPA